MYNVSKCKRYSDISMKWVRERSRWAKTEGVGHFLCPRAHIHTAELLHKYFESIQLLKPCPSSCNPDRALECSVSCLLFCSHRKYFWATPSAPPYFHPSYPLSCLPLPRPTPELSRMPICLSHIGLIHETIIVIWWKLDHGLVHTHIYRDNVWCQLDCKYGSKVVPSDASGMPTNGVLQPLD